VGKRETSNPVSFCALVVCVWYVCGVLVVCVWCAYGMYMVCLWCAYGMYMVYMLFAKWMSVFYPVSVSLFVGILEVLL
jgi:hypothetical protein